MYRRHGGYVAKRRSTFSRIINHYLWSPDMVRWWYYAALSGKRRGWWFEAIWFRGEVREGR